MIRLLLFVSLTVSLVGASGCQGCINPNLPDDQEDPITSEDSGDTPQDSADPLPVDTGPPPPCDLVEVEPNNFATPQAIELEQIVCGAIDMPNDIEVFTFTAPRAGWYMIQARAQTIGSVADLQLVADDDEDVSIFVERSFPGSRDPRIIFPIAQEATFTVALRDINNSGSEDHFWEFLASEVKEPITWNDEALEPNNRANAIETGDGTLIYGVLERNDRDWFRFESPSDRATAVYAVHAWRLNSPLDPRVFLYSPSAGEDPTADVRAAFGEDPQGEFPLDETGTWYLEISPDSSGGVNQVTSDAHWYVVELRVEDNIVEE